MAVLPAMCEELAFRGFILSGLRHLGSKWWAIGLTAVFFGMAHGVIQQSLAAAALGLVIGYIAVQTGSLVPCILFHVTYNALMFSMAELAALYADSTWAVRACSCSRSPDVMLYIWPVTLICALAAAVLLWWLHRLPYQATREEADQRGAGPAVTASGERERGVSNGWPGQRSESAHWALPSDLRHAGSGFDVVGSGSFPSNSDRCRFLFKCALSIRSIGRRLSTAW